MKRRIEAKNGSITRVDRQFAEEKTNYNSSVEAIEAKRALEVNAMSDLVSQVECIKLEVESLAQEVETDKLMAAQAADELVQWEETVKTTINTKDLVNKEKVNIESLKTELHNKQVKAEQIAKNTKELMEALAHCVSRRDTLVNRAVATNAHRASTRPQTTRVLLNRKTDDLKNKLKKLAREEKELTVLIHQCENQEAHWETQLGENSSQIL